MRNCEIKISITKLLRYSDNLRPQIDNETLVNIMREFSSYIRRLYLTMLNESMNSRKYKGKWEPVNDPGYLEYIGTTPSEDILLLMYRALEVREIKNDIIIRINPRVKYPNSKRTLVSVLKAIDNGTSKFNARPLIKIVIRNINRELINLWKGYLKTKGVA